MGRRLLALALRRSLSQRPSAPAALGLAHCQPLCERSGVANHPASDQCEAAKNPWGTAWVAAASLMAFSTTAKTVSNPVLEKEEASSNGNHGSTLLASRKPRVVFVLGGPGSGKGTQCAKVVENFGFEHLSAGDLLRAEMNSGSKNGTMIQNMIKEGTIVPSEVTVKLIQHAMERSKTNKFLIDGFPRNEENRAAFERVTGITPEFILFFDCPEEEMERRILGRNQGRVDDNIETIRKRFHVFIQSSLPVVEYYESIGKVRKVNAMRSVDEVFDSIQPLFKPFVHDDLALATQQLLDGIDKGDYEVYKLLCDRQLTAFEPEAQGQLVEGLPFHKYYFDQKVAGLKKGSLKLAQSTVCAKKITIIGNVGLVTYTRLMQKEGFSREGDTDSYNETRVWERRKNGEGVWEWKHIHFHRSRAPVA